MSLEHVPVMPQQSLEGLSLQADGLYWDGTFGRGGHSRMILERLGPSGRLIASDRDAAAEAEAGTIVDPRFSFRRGTIEEVLADLPDQLTGFFWDLGTSMPQLRDAQRGFSFAENGPLDMRMDQSQELTAADLVNQTQEEALADLIYQYGEERFSRRLASRIVARRREAPIEDTQTLAEICRKVYPFKRNHRIDPATRTFQALRIVVNDELGQLERCLEPALNRLVPGGRAVIISFHSLEDRIVKHTFRGLAKGGFGTVLTKKPLVADDTERAANPASRSAKLRVIERGEEAS